MTMSCACALSANCSIRSLTSGGRLAICRSYSNLYSSSVMGAPSVGVGLVGADHATRELSPRLYRGGDHA